MKTIFHVTVFLLFVLSGSVELFAQQRNTNSIESIKSKAENGNSAAQSMLGYDYFSGHGVSQDYTEAVNWYRKAAEQGNVLAQYNLGVCFRDGLGVTQDPYEAAKWLRKAAESGFAQAQYNLGVLYSDGQGVAQDYGQAAILFQKASDHGIPEAEYNLGVSYENGQGVKQDYKLAMNWFQKAADHGIALAQYNLGVHYDTGRGVQTNYIEAMKWYSKAANQGDAIAQYSIGIGYYEGKGTIQDYMQAVEWFRRSSDQGYSTAQCMLGFCYEIGLGVTQNYLNAYIWFSLAASQGSKEALQERDIDASHLSQDEIAEGQRRAATFVPRIETVNTSSDNAVSPESPTATGTGFFITDDGFLISNYHVVKGAAKVRVLTSSGLIDVKIVLLDAANDLALLKAEGKFSALPILPSRSVQLGSVVATVGFPDIDLQGLSPKLAKGEIASLSGAADDPRYFQISVPLQPGNSGGPLVDERGNVIGVVSARLDDLLALTASGALPENVNYAVKSGFLLSFLESVPSVSSKLETPNTADEKFEDVVKAAQNASVLVEVY
jgi:TPR repeat protein